LIFILFVFYLYYLLYCTAICTYISNSLIRYANRTKEFRYISITIIITVPEFYDASNINGRSSDWNEQQVQSRYRDVNHAKWDRMWKMFAATKCEKINRELKIARKQMEKKTIKLAHVRLSLPFKLTVISGLPLNIWESKLKYLNIWVNWINRIIWKTNLSLVCMCECIYKSFKIFLTLNNILNNDKISIYFVFIFYIF